MRLMGLGDSEINAAGRGGLGAQDGSQTPKPQDSESPVLLPAPWGRAVLLGDACPGHGSHCPAGWSRAPPEADETAAGRKNRCSFAEQLARLRKWVRPWEEQSPLLAFR